MNTFTAGSEMSGNRWAIRCAITAVILIMAIGLYLEKAMAETTWTPAVAGLVVQDDNISFSRSDPKDDVIYLVKPQFSIKYDQELTKLETKAVAAIKRYSENDELNNETYRLDVEGKSNMTERFVFGGKYEFIKDTTLDSELLETGHISTSRDDRFSHHLKLNPSFNLTERSGIGVGGSYRDVRYDSDSFVDYAAWNVNVSLRRQLVTEVDTIFMSPGFGRRQSDTKESNSYNLIFGWQHETTERLNFRFTIGARYTETDTLSNDKEDEDFQKVTRSDESYGGVGSLKLNYDYLTGSIMLDIRHNLSNTASGAQINVTQFWTQLQKKFSQRFRMELNGRYYYTQNEGDSSDDTRQFYQADVRFLYKLTENHNIFIAYEYSQDHLDNVAVDEDGSAERNKFWAGVKFNFPMK